MPKVIKSRRSNLTASVQIKFDFTKSEPINLIAKFDQNGQTYRSRLKFARKI